MVGCTDARPHLTQHAIRLGSRVPDFYLRNACKIPAKSQFCHSEGFIARCLTECTGAPRQKCAVGAREQHHAPFGLQPLGQNIQIGLKYRCFVHYPSTYDHWTIMNGQHATP
jgi:hypothetical protein